MKLSTLYTLDSRGKVRVFECEVNNGIFPSNEAPFEGVGHDHPMIITRTGLLNGKLIEKKEIVSTGRQGRSITEQAEFQAKSLHEEKWNEGYKSVASLYDLQFKYTNPCYEIYEETVIGAEKYLRAYPKAAYTNINNDELPMLAHKFKDIKNPEFPYYAQPKLNGVRCLVKVDEYASVGKGEPFPLVKMCSRGGQYYQIEHLKVILGELFNQIQKVGTNEKFILDGEIYKHGIPLQDISGAARSEDSSMFASNHWLEYHIYDVIREGKAFWDQTNRILDLNEIGELVKDNPYIKVVTTGTVQNKEEVKILHDSCIQQGYEGLILRKPDSKYEFNQRSKNLLKVKQYEDAEFIIKGSAMQTSEPESFVFILGNDINNEVFKARPTGTLKQKEEWHHNIDNYLGKKATVRFFERSKDGLPLQACVQSKLTPILIEHIRPTDE